jgi:hypothetical protein
MALTRRKPTPVRKIAFARLSSAFARSNAFIRAESAVVTPGRAPAST